jgi:hypothetical protein
MNRLAIIGAGPIGLEAALLATQKGYDVSLLERGPSVATNVRRWAHVRFFSPWKLNRSPWGEEALRNAGVELGDAEAFPTGGEYVAEYLDELAVLPAVADALRFDTEVLRVSRGGAHKGELIGGRGPGAGPFMLHVRQGDDEAYVEADFVLDTSGVYDDGQPLGPGGLPALGELALGDAVERFIPDVLGAERANYAGKRTLVVGTGYSAVTTVKALHDLKADEPRTEIFWAMQGGDEPYPRIPNDSLPQRDALAAFANDVAAGRVEEVNPIVDAEILATRGDDDTITVQFAGDVDDLEVDALVANTGYRPNLDLARELQIHLCYASEGPMKLAASLLAASGGADCLDQESAGVDTLRSPEGDYFIAGMKSYGRNSMFLLKVGYDQIAEILGEGFSRQAAAE